MTTHEKVKAENPHLVAWLESWDPSFALTKFFGSADTRMTFPGEPPSP